MIKEQLLLSYRVLHNSCRRFYYDDCFSRASALTYATLFALIPITYVTIWAFGLLGEEQAGASEKFQVILSQVLPPIESQGFKDQIFSNLQSFANNVSEVKNLSIAVLLFSIFTLINTTESALNVVWRVNSSKSVFSKFTDFSTVGILGPILISFSFFLSSEISSNVPEGLLGFYNHYLPLLLPVTVTCLALTLLFYKLPSAVVPLKHALVGGFVSAVLFEIAKIAFAAFFEHASTYSKVYGVIASIPVFLIWLYVLWAIVLFGAELAYNCANARHLESLRKYNTEFGSPGALIALKLLTYIVERYENGDNPPEEGELAACLGAEPPVVRVVLDCLTNANILTSPDEKHHTRALTKSPESLSIGSVYEAFGAKDADFLDRWREISSSLSKETSTRDVSLKSLIK